jgi:hypothetical protein
MMKITFGRRNQQSIIMQITNVLLIIGSINSLLLSSACQLKKERSEGGMDQGESCENRAGCQPLNYLLKLLDFYDGKV